MTDPDTDPRDTPEFRRRRQRRSLVLVAVLIFWAVLVYAVSILRMGAS